MTITSRWDGKCTKCGHWFKAGTQVLWFVGVKGAAHVTCPQTQQVRVDIGTRTEQTVTVPVVEVKLSLAPIFDFINAAKARGLKKPGARFLAPGNEELRVYISGPRSSVPNSLQVLVQGEWLGRVLADGTVHGSKLKDDGPLQAVLLAIAKDPAAAAKAYGALFCKCSFCDKKLQAEGPGASVEVGYGPDCAKHYGLPWKRGIVRDVTKVDSTSQQ